MCGRSRRAARGADDIPLTDAAAIQAAILDRLAHMLRLELARPVQIRDRAGDIEAIDVSSLHSAPMSGGLAIVLGPGNACLS